MAVERVYEYVPHQRTKEKIDVAAGPAGADAEPAAVGAVARFNSRVAVKVTSGVGTMWCAYAFAALALVSLPAAVRSHSLVVVVAWISQTFLQLVLLSVVLVGQNELAATTDRRAEETHNDADAVLHEVVKLQEHLLAQDRVLGDLRAQLRGSPS